MIEKRITETTLDGGEIALTDRERDELELPLHSTTVEMAIEGEPFNGQWSGAGRFLHGDILGERLQDFGQVGGLLRLLRIGDVLRLELVAPRHSTVPAPRATPPRPREQPKPIQSGRNRRPPVQQFYSDGDYDWTTGIDDKVGFVREARLELTEQLAKSGFDPAEWLTLRLEGEQLATLDEFEELLAVDVSNVERMPHQEAVASRVLAKMRGRAILADEVGLGKTIEAGLAVKELVMRGLARRVLVLCPASLREQWQQELLTKFELTFDVAWRGDEIGDQDRLVLSLTLGARNVDRLTDQPWDVVIIDEAHRAAGATAKKIPQLVGQLSSAAIYVLFLTATPVQNDLMELYRLVQLLRPGTFESAVEFRRRFMQANDPRRPKDPADLRRLMSSAMVRTTRSQAGLDRVKRVARDIPVVLDQAERDLYDRYIKLLRAVAASPTRQGRTRSLGVLLTALPAAMGARLLRMAKQVEASDPGLAAELGDLADRALNITDSSRERAAISLVRNFLDEHGRVLMFTQHTDSLTALVRALGREDIEAAAFHGSMSPTERARSIAAFRSGEKPVLVSTDAGAEGQNLQFCNCVVNFDLPWNPMRIEQRIGRVDRLTQPKDTVYVANLFAVGTVDERVYRLLAEKLRMFELLFGQVTTILGELDDSDLTFEGRITRALTSTDDAQMSRELDLLGDELSRARAQASNFIAADSSLSSWLRTTLDHRDTMDERSATELAVGIEERARDRQRRVQRWVRSIIAELGAELVHDTGERAGAFVTVRFPEHIAEELGGRSVLHLAFDRDGLDHHPDAELCAVGTPVFSELLQIVRQRGDIHATVSVLPDLGAVDVRHSDSVELVERRFVPSGSWRGEAVFRASIGETETSELVETIAVGDHADDGVAGDELSRRPLDPGEPLPVIFGDATAVVKRFERAAADRLSALRRDRYELVRRERAEELTRVKAGYAARIGETSPAEAAGLQRAAELEQQRLGRDPDVRARARLLAITIGENDPVIEEQWRHRNGHEETRRYEWRRSGPQPLLSEASRQFVNVVSLCSAGHWIDEREATRCDSCDEDRCQACGADAQFAPCEMCGTPTCGSCRASTGGFCIPCRVPERAPELDSPAGIGWRFQSGTTLLVSERGCVISRPDGTKETVVPEVDVDADDRIRVRAFATWLGLAADTGLSVKYVPAPTAANDGLLLLRDVSFDVAITMQPDGGGEIDQRGVEHLPLRPEVDVVSERGAGLAPVLSRLRAEHSPPPAPSIRLVRRPLVREVRLSEDSLADVVTRANADGTTEFVERHEASIVWGRPTPTTAILGFAEINGYRVELELCNEAVLVKSESGRGTNRWIALADGHAAGEQLAWARLLVDDGVPGGLIGQRDPDPPLDTDRFPKPSDCELLGREISRVVRRQPARGGVRPASVAQLRSLGAREVNDAQLNAVPDELAAAWLQRAARPYTTEIATGSRVSETWKGHAVATHEYVTYDLTPLSPLEGDRPPEREFDICSSGHFFASGEATLCAACSNCGCGRCAPDVVASTACPTCQQAACGRCLAEPHRVATAVCAVCGDGACETCGRDPHVEGCAICERPTCVQCRPGTACRACSSLSEASIADVERLPEDLAALGGNVWTGHDAGGTVAIIRSGARVERATVRPNGAIADWVAYDALDDKTAAVTRALGRLLGAAVEVAPGPTRKPESPIPYALPAHRNVAVHAEWEAASLGRTGVSPRGHSTTNNELLDDLLAHVGQDQRFVTPRRSRDLPDAVRQLVDRVKDHTVSVEVFWAAVGTEVFVTPDGLVSRECAGTFVDDSLDEWSAASDSWSWIDAAWDPQPAVRAVAAADGVDAAVISVAATTFLGFKVGDSETWVALDGPLPGLGASALAHDLGLAGADVVGIGPWTDARSISTSSVTNASETRAVVTPVGGLTHARGVHSDAGTAMVAWDRDLAPRQPHHSLLTVALGDPFAQRFRPRNRQVLIIGASIEQRFVVDGDEIRFVIDLAPGEHDARRRDDITGELLDEGVIDRSKHFVATAAVCPYCHKLSCDLCVKQVRPCPACTTAICSACATAEPGLSLCPACATVAPATRAQAREHGRRLRSKGMVIGTDPIHTVVYERRGSGWIRQVGDDTVDEVVVTKLQKHLNERAQQR